MLRCMKCLGSPPPSSATHLVDVDAVSAVEADLGGVPEPVAGWLGGGHNDTLNQDTSVDDGHHLGLLLDRRGNWKGGRIERLTYGLISYD